MKDEEILKKAIEKAVEGGWKPQSIGVVWAVVEQGLYRSIIFLHDFAKAFFGDRTLDIRELGFEPITDKTKTVAWKFHLLAMVLEEEPLLYLGKFLEEK